MSVARLFVKLPIRNKIAVAFVVVLAMVGVLGFAAVDRLTTLSRTVDLITGDTMVGIDELSGMREGLLRYRLAVARYMTVKDLNPDFDTNANLALASYRAHETKYAPTAQSPEERVLYGEVRRAMQDYLELDRPGGFVLPRR